MSSKSTRVVVAMSGGVDSSVAAAILKKEGYEVIGVTMKLWTEADTNFPHNHRRCCSVEEMDDARRVCQILDIPFYVLNFEPQFQTHVVEYFCSEYHRGRTPNPCLACNKYIKFGFLLDKALSLEANLLATGHYARIKKRNECYLLLKATDVNKDQSYVLYALGQRELEHLLFPLGYYNKSQTRHLAQEMGLPVWNKVESQEICFITDGGYHRFVAGHNTYHSGEIVDTQGKVLGKHQGIGFYTIGQRHGLGLVSHEPLYVLSIDPTSNRVVVGTNDQLLHTELIASELNFISREPSQKPMSITAKIRYRSPEAKAMLYPEGQQARIRFEEPQRAITPGQAVVFYQDDVVLGGGLIESVGSD